MYYMQKYHKNSGFTLIELLIAFVILGLISTYVAIISTDAITKQRDVQRKHDIKQIRTALELYRSDRQVYPASNLVACNAQMVEGNGVYMAHVPCDPKSGGNYLYTVTANGFAYCLRACLEPDDATESDPESDIERYGVNNPDGTTAQRFTNCAGVTMQCPTIPEMTYSYTVVNE